MGKKNANDERISIYDLHIDREVIDKPAQGITDKGEEPALVGIITKWSGLVRSMRKALVNWHKNKTEDGVRLSESLDVWYRGVYSSQKSDENQAKNKKNDENHIKSQKQKKWLTEYALTPKVQRHSWTIEQERVMYLEFERLAEGIGAPNTPRYWSTYFKMQHYGMPTRLLDWTEGFLTALYFAVDAPRLSIEDGLSVQDTDPAAVFVLFPQVLNFLSWSNEFSNESQLSHRKVRGRFLHEFRSNSFHYTVDSRLRHDSVDSKEHEPCDLNYPLSEYELREPNEKDYPIFPAALRPSYQDPRIRGQRSVFTIHGQSLGFKKLIKEVSEVKELKGIPFLGVIEIEKEKVTQLKNEVMQMGISRKILFPDLAGLTDDMFFEYTKGNRSRFPVR